MKIDRERFDRLWNAVETMSTRMVAAEAEALAVAPPTNDAGWDLVMEYTPEGEQRLVWDRPLEVVIDSADFQYEGPPPGPERMQVDRAVYDQIWDTTRGMESAGEIAAYVISQGVSPPDGSPDWEVYFSTFDGYNGEERLVWHRVESVPITPSDGAVEA